MFAAVSRGPRPLLNLGATPPAASLFPRLSGLGIAQRTVRVRRIGTAGHAGEVPRGPPLPVPGLRIGAGVEQHLDRRSGMATVCGEMQGCATVFGARVWIGAGGKQHLDDLGAFVATCGVADDAHVPIPDGLVQSRVQILTAPGNPLTEGVHVRAGGEQGLDDFDIAIPDSELQSGISILPGIRIPTSRDHCFNFSWRPVGLCRLGEVRQGDRAAWAGARSVVRRQRFLWRQVTARGCIGQPVVREAGVVTETGRSREAEDKDNGKRLH